MEKKQENKLRRAAAALKKVHTGGKITNSEINAALEEYEDVEKKLAFLGPKFHLAWKELMFDLKKLKEFKIAREHKLYY